jgi:hypothetical protein
MGATMGATMGAMMGAMMSAPRWWILMRRRLHVDDKRDRGAPESVSDVRRAIGASTNQGRKPHYRCAKSTVMRHCPLWTPAALCPGVLFAKAFWLPIGVVDVMVWLTAMGLEPPVAIPTYRAATRLANRESAVLSVDLRRWLRLLSALALAIGLGALACVASVTRPAAAILGPTLLGQAALLVVLVGVGAQLLRRPSGPADRSNGAWSAGRHAGRA